MSQTTRGIARPRVIAHRGASADAPEHTIAAFELAISQGAEGIELDVHLSKDDQLVVIHDFTLDRTTEGFGPVRARTVRELKRLDAGGWRGDAFRGQRIQTLHEVLERFRERTAFWVEVKGGTDVYPGIEERVLSAIEVYDVVERTLVQSFDDTVLRRIRNLNDAARVGSVITRTTWSQERGLLQAICPEAGLLDGEKVAEILDAGLECYPWTVNEPALMDRLVDCRVSGIITDRPALLRDRLARWDPAV